MRDIVRVAGIAAAALAASAGIASYLALSQPAPGTHEPRDGRGWILAARERMDAGRFEAAIEAYEKGLAASRKVAADPQVWCELADAIGVVQGRSLRGRPGELIARALALNPNHPRALEMAGSAAYEAGDFTTALAYWEPLLAQLRAGTPPHGELAAAIERTRAQRDGRPG